jgi:hypothetical protein
MPKVPIALDIELRFALWVPTAERRNESVPLPRLRPRPSAPGPSAKHLLELDGRDLRREPWSDRRWKLARLLRGAGHGAQPSDHIEGNDGEAAFRHACAMGLEGIVAKRRDRPYRSGRSPDWVKIKNPGAPAVIRVIEGGGRPW